MLNTEELKTLEIIADKDRLGNIPRAHLEKLSRLDLIEPGYDRVTLSIKGQEILFKRK